MAGVRFSVDTSNLDKAKNKLFEASTLAEHAVAVQAMKDTEPYVPALTESLSSRTQVYGSTILYPGPYARYLYYGKVMVDEHGNGPRHFLDKNGNEVIAFPKGSKLHATNKDLVFTQTVHPQAQAHWFEASKAENLNKWLQVAERSVRDEFKK